MLADETTIRRLVEQLQAREAEIVHLKAQNHELLSAMRDGLDRVMDIIDHGISSLSPEIHTTSHGTIERVWDVISAKARKAS